MLSFSSKNTSTAFQKSKFLLVNSRFVKFYSYFFKKNQVDWIKNESNWNISLKIATLTHKFWITYNLLDWLKNADGRTMEIEGSRIGRVETCEVFTWRIHLTWVKINYLLIMGFLRPKLEYFPTFIGVATATHIIYNLFLLSFKGLTANLFFDKWKY